MAGFVVVVVVGEGRGGEEAAERGGRVSVTQRTGHVGTAAKWTDPLLLLHVQQSKHFLKTSACT